MQRFRSLNPHPDFTPRNQIKYQCLFFHRIIELCKSENISGWKGLGRPFVQPSIWVTVYFVLCDLLEQSRLSRALSSQVFLISNWWASFIPEILANSTVFLLTVLTFTFVLSTRFPFLFLYFCFLAFVPEGIRLASVVHVQLQFLFEIFSQFSKQKNNNLHLQKTTSDKLTTGLDKLLVNFFAEF